MRRILTLTILATVALAAVAQEEGPDKIVITGSVQSDILIPQEDEKIGTGTYDDFALTNTYADLQLRSKYVEAGARFAQPGEFTRRAFLNGKMDLAQAEAVADVISSTTAASHRVAMNQLKGGFSKELARLRAELLEMASLLELELDFSEEDVEFADREKLLMLLEATRTHVDRLAASFHQGNMIKNGVPVAIVGAANAGKSTLLNALVGEERAIVTDIPGTTRDTIEEVISVPSGNCRRRRWYWGCWTLRRTARIWQRNWHFWGSIGTAVLRN